MRRGNNPTRRSRKIGMAAQGHGQANRLTIPAPWNFWARLRNPIWVERTVDGRPVTIAVEPPNRGCLYSVTPDDITTVLSLLPSEHHRDIGLVALRQPSRKQETIEPVWGRLRYHVDIGHYSGPCIVIEAVRTPMRREIRHPRPLDTAEIERLKALGHRVTQTRRGVLVESDLASIRATQLYVTLPHEVGHYVDYLEKVENPDDLSWENEQHRWDAYWARPVDEHEVFAHRYADDFRAAMSVRGDIPFPQDTHPAALRADGLTPAWFGVNEATDPA